MTLPHPEEGRRPVSKGEGGFSKKKTGVGLLLATLLLTALPAFAALNLPPLTGRVADLANVLSPATEAALSEQLAAHEQRTSNQVVVATVPSLQGYDIERFANELFRAWALGQKNRNNGVLFLVAPNEREVRIEVGYGLEGTLTDALSADIIQNRILPRFRAGDIPGGITSGVDAILAAIEGTYQPVATPHSSSDQYRALIPVLFFIGWLVLVNILSNRRRRGRWVYGSGVPGVWIGGPGWGGRGGFGGSGGGGFSGGGGSSGGGGASGRW
jgi:uncharacterized protein